MQRNPGRVCARGRLVEVGERFGVGVEEIGGDEGRVASSEDSEIDHDEAGWVGTGLKG